MNSHNKKRRQRGLCPFCRRKEKRYRRPDCGRLRCKAAYRAHRIKLGQRRRELLGQDRSDVVDPNPARRAAKLDQVAARIRYEQHLLNKAGLDPVRCTAMAADRVIGKN